MRRLPKPSPAVLVSLVALFFALGGTAFAVSSKLAPQSRCTTGAIRGIADVNGESVDGVGNISMTYSSNRGLFGYSWSCTGGSIDVRQSRGALGFDVQFVGNPATVAYVSSEALGVPDAGSISRSPDGSFHITMGGSNTGVPGPWQAQANVPFVIVLFYATRVTRPRACSPRDARRSTFPGSGASPASGRGASGSRRRTPAPAPRRAATRA
jgi:hypothetical protein